MYFCHRSIFFLPKHLQSCVCLEAMQIWRHQKMNYFEPSPPFNSLALIFLTSFPPCHRPKSDKVFPEKPSEKLYSGFNILHVYYTIPHTWLPFFEQLNKKTFVLHGMN